MMTVPTPTDSFVGPDLIIEGTVRGHGALRVAGTMKGTVAIAGAMILERGAEIEGEVEAASLTVAPGARMRGTATFGWSASERRTPFGPPRRSGSGSRESSTMSWLTTSA